MPFSISLTPSRHNSGIVRAESAVDATVNMGGVSSAKIIVIQRIFGTMTIDLTLASEELIAMPIGKLFILECSEDPIESITVSGTGEFEYFIAEW